MMESSHDIPVASGTVRSRWRKKPVVIDAVYWDGTEKTLHERILPFVDFDKLVGDGTHIDKGIGYTPPSGELTIPTLEGEMRAQPGDWIIWGVQGEMYPCKEDIFVATYEPAYEARGDDTGTDESVAKTFAVPNGPTYDTDQGFAQNIERQKSGHDAGTTGYKPHDYTPGKVCWCGESNQAGDDVGTPVEIQEAYLLGSEDHWTHVQIDRRHEAEPVRGTCGRCHVPSDKECEWRGNGGISVEVPPAVEAEARLMLRLHAVLKKAGAAPPDGTPHSREDLIEVADRYLSTGSASDDHYALTELLHRAVPLIRHKSMCYGLRNFERECDCGAYKVREDYRRMFPVSSDTEGPDS